MKATIIATVQFMAALLICSHLLYAKDLAKNRNIEIAYFASSSQNSFNQALYEGIQNEAQKFQGVSTTIFDGKFDATTQFNQIEDAMASKKYDAFIIFANDTVGIAPVVDEAIDSGYKVVAAFFPIGPDLSTLEPQLKGLSATIGRPPADGARRQAQAVTSFCKDKNPCNVVIMIGQKIYPFDNLRYNTYLDELKAHKNINIIATIEGNYSPDVSLKGMQDTLQQNKRVDVVLSTADQHLVGAEIALDDAGYRFEDIFMIGTGASKRGVTKIREGKWDASLSMLPYTLGKIALQSAVNSVKGKPVEKVVNMDSAVSVPALIDKAYLDNHPDFIGEWE